MGLGTCFSRDGEDCFWKGRFIPSITIFHAVWGRCMGGILWVGSARNMGYGWGYCSPVFEYLWLYMYMYV